MHDLRRQLIEKIQALGVIEQPVPGRDDGFSALLFQGKAFAHFHNDNELDLRLTKRIIVREGLVHFDDSIYHPRRSANSQWVEIRFTQPEHLNELIRLIRIAIKEN